MRIICQYDSQSRFVTDNSDENGFVVKMPYTTNSEFIKFAKDYAQVLEHIALAARQYAERVCYTMVQPCMHNRQEYRVVVLGGQAQYLATVEKKAKGADTHKFSVSPHTSLFEFAENAVRALRMRCPEAIADYIMRVDIFQRKDGRLVVNEFESLEACIYSAKNGETKAKTWMAVYLHEKLISSVSH